MNSIWSRRVAVSNTARIDVAKELAPKIKSGVEIVEVPIASELKSESISIMGCRVQCCSTKKHSKCSDNGSSHQPFPNTGPLASENQRNLSLNKLRKKIADKDNPYVYFYVIATIEYDGQQFRQKGTGPNFQGDLITLCTCKHYMRSSMDADKWRGKWIAGFTSRMKLQDQEKRNYLVYLMRVSDAFESFQELWNNNIPDETKKAKAAHLHRLGDIYEPKDCDPSKSFRAEHYESPCEQLGENYNHDGCWRKNIEYYNERSKRRAALLVGDKSSSFLWEEPKINYKELLSRGYGKIKFDEFLDKLEKK
jgi:hypothetical protein